MAENKSSLSGSRSYEELSEYWDTHSLADHWDQTSPVEFELDIRSSALYFPVDRLLADKLRAVAASHGVSTETLLNLWLQERVAAESHKAG
jgi:CopG antitoxin of type II toxin-antitoxin system